MTSRWWSTFYDDSSTRHRHQISSAPLSVRLVTVVPAAAVNDLEIHLDADLTSGSTSTPLSGRRSRRFIRSVVSGAIFSTHLLTLIHSLVVTKVDYCNSLIVGVSNPLLSRLQSVLNAVARIISSRRSNHIAPLLCELHSLRVSEWILYLSVCMVQRRPTWSTVFDSSQTLTEGVDFVPPACWHCSCHSPVAPLLATALFLSLRHGRGTVSHLQFTTPRWRLTIII